MPRYAQPLSDIEADDEGRRRDAVWQAARRPGLLARPIGCAAGWLVSCAPGWLVGCAPGASLTVTWDLAGCSRLAAPLQVSACYCGCACRAACAPCLPRACRAGCARCSRFPRAKLRVPVVRACRGWETPEASSHPCDAGSSEVQTVPFR